MTRRALLRGTALVAAAPFINRGRFSLFARTGPEYSTRTLDLLRESTVVDMLGLLTLDYPKLNTWRTNPASFQASDLQRLKDSAINVFHPAVGFTEGDIYNSSLSDIRGWDAFLAEHSSDFVRIDCPGDMERAKAAGKIGIVIGLQNSAHFRSVDDVQRFYEMGQRVSQLTYTDNELGGGSVDPHDPGLSEYGVRIVDRMNTLGMAIDISHCGDRTTLDTISLSRKPVLVTHSNCRALVPRSARCKTDDAIRRMAARGGVIGITMIRYFVSSGGPATMENVLDHIDHIVKLTGAEHVGIGSDVDLNGRDRQLHPLRKNDLDGVDYERKIYDVTEGLVRRKYSDEDIKLILGGNFQRALSEIWAG